ncbi:hypothetical protein KI387_004920 [Taxus chinensis]|uniref:Squamosa promoter-binding-like protein 14 n=1 Tax=Taxus chinensis TaxID=29808 RepID=A0AA38LKR1_TAXCH|nr:hypothetical protein KI387_004920 [Taxus chinensis]
MDKLLGRMLSDKDYLVQCLSKLKSLSSSEDLTTNTMRTHSAIDLNISQDMQPQTPKQDTKVHVLQTNSLQSPVANIEMVRVLSTLIQRSPEALSLLHRSLMRQQTSNLQSHDELVNNQFPGIKPANFASGIVNGMAGSGSRDKVAEHSTSRDGLGFPLHLPEILKNTHFPNHWTSRQSFANFNPMEERLSSRSPSSSPPVVQNFFPLHSRDDSKENESVSVGEEIELTPDQSPSDDGHYKIRISNSGKSSYQHYTSSGSDQSPTSSNSDTQERTSRIIFKLFGKDPSDFPQTLRTQILEWLSYSPSDMESYIRPGCVILSVFASMPKVVWDQLRGDLQERMKLLLFKDCGSDFWKSGRILVQAEQQLVSFKSGKIEFCRSRRSLKAPKILSVRPIAVVAGEETRLILTGHNLMTPGTKGKYVSENVVPQDHQVCSATLFNTCSMIEHTFSGGPPDVLGRLFVEVERGLKGNSFPVIVADSAICRELRSLEGDIDIPCEVIVTNKHSKMHSQDDVKISNQEDVVSFLNELGWLFQRNSYSEKKPPSPGGFLGRFKFLLTYAVERDWNALLKRILDIFFSMYAEEGSIQEALAVMSEIHLLHRAVKRNCRQIVDLLLCYLPLSSANGNFAFSPDVIGPGGLTPLHIC